VDSAPLSGIVDNKEVSTLVKQVLNNKKVNFKKITKIVKKNIKKAAKVIKKKTVSKLVKTIQKVINAGNPKLVQKHLTLAEKEIKVATKVTGGVGKKVEGLLASYQGLVGKVVTAKGKKGKNILNKIKKMGKNINKTILNAIANLNIHLTNLERILAKLFTLSPKSAAIQESIKKLDNMIVIIKNALKTVLNADKSMKVLEAAAKKL
jgi:hypothetical protein